MSAANDELLDGMLSDFLDESSQLVDRLNENLLRLDAWVGSLADEASSECDMDLLNEMFRSAHSIKGLSAMLGLENVNTLTHKMENVLDAARRRELQVSRDAVDLLFQSLDRLTGMFDLLRTGGGDNVDCGTVVDGIQRLLRGAGCEREATSQADAERALQDLTASAPPTAAPEPEDFFAAIADEQDVSQKYLAIFIDEAQLALDELTETLLDGERCSSPEALQHLMTTAHRLKGSAACVGLHRPAKLAHLMEDVLQRLNEAQGAIAPETADALLRCTDALRKYIDGWKTNRPDSSTFNAAAWELLRAPKPSDKPAATPKAAPTKESASASIAKPTPAADWRGPFAAAMPEGEPGYFGRISFTPGFPLATLKAQLLCEKLAQAGTLHRCVPDAAALETLDTVEHLTFAVTSDLARDVLHAQLAIVGTSQVELEVIEANSAPVAKPQANSETPVAATVKSKAPAPPTEAEAKATEAAKPNETLRVDIERLDQLMNLAGELTINKARFTRINEGLKHVGVGKQAKAALTSTLDQLRLLTDDQAELRLEDLAAFRSRARRMAHDLEIVSRSIDEIATARREITDLGEAVHQLTRVADGIQKSVMDTRMVPVGPLFTRFRRVVRDITRLNDKDIRLEINGEKTELDKRMIDELGDPLIHMVRNSADHGVEHPDVREKAGKPRQGVITLDAFHRGNSIVIRVSDDGKGLDRERIKAKAIEKGLITPADAERLTPAETFALIWAPGFSTAEKITEISGRGMGMDIVKSKIEAINGTVEIDSEPGVGTSISIKLPLTLAILPSLLARINDVVYALPIESVNEIINVAPEDVTTVHGKPATNVRGRVISIVGLSDLFAWGGRRRSIAIDRTKPTTLVVLGFEGRELGLVVDYLLGEEDVVIKSLAENYRNVEGLSGACVLGDGRVSLILDTASLLQLSAKAGSNPFSNEEFR
jgi:two-component system chemotaxis sensor kinase CheA